MRSVTVVTITNPKMVHESDCASFLEDLRTIAELHTQRNVAVDFKDVQFCSAGCLAYLDRFRRCLADIGLTLEIRNMPPHIFHICHLIGLAKTFTIVDEETGVYSATSAAAA